MLWSHLNNRIFTNTFKTTLFLQQICFVKALCFCKKLSRTRPSSFLAITALYDAIYPSVLLTSVSPSTLLLLLTSTSPSTPLYLFIQA